MKLIITDIKNFALPVKGEHKIIKPDSMVKHCIGCFGCWIKTPGECVIKDGFHCTGWDMGKCEELIMISECLYGGFSSFVKKVQDRCISYVRPDFDIVNDEMRHRRRYFNKIKLSAYFTERTSQRKRRSPQRISSKQMQRISMPLLKKSCS